MKAKKVMRAKKLPPGFKLPVLAVGTCLMGGEP
jgi:hypothetical protein